MTANDIFEIQMSAWREQFCCNECGNDRIAKFKYDRRVANGEVWICGMCKSERLVDDEPSKDYEQ